MSDKIKLTERIVQKQGKPKPFDWREFAVPHDTLLNKQIEPIEFLIDGMIVSFGTGVLAGPKKKGKSWLGLQLSQAVASGGQFLGHHVKQCGVVHFALEDGERRTQARLKQQKAQSDLPIVYFYFWPAWNTDPGLKQLELMIQELKPGLILVDTFAKCLNRKPDQNSAGDMGDFGNRVHDLALKYNLMILFIAHHGKMSTRDPGNDIRGSSAIPAATDVNIGLYKNDDGTFELIGEGRDIEDFDVRVKLDKEQTWAWQLEGDAVDVRRAEAERKILDAIKVLGDSVDAATIAEQADIARNTAQYHLERMRKQENPPVTFEVREEGKRKKKKILYSLTSLSLSTDKTQ